MAEKTTKLQKELSTLEAERQRLMSMRENHWHTMTHIARRACSQRQMFIDDRCDEIRAALKLAEEVGHG